MPSRRSLLKSATSLITAAFLFPSTAFADEPISVVATFSILGDMVARIGGEQIDLVTLVEPGGDAHVFQPTPRHAAAVAEAELLFMNGLEFEGWLERLSEAAPFTGEMVIATTGIKAIAFEDNHDDHDEHEDEHASDDDHDHDKHEDEHADHDDHDHDKHEDEHADHDDHDHDKHGEEHADHDDHDHDKHEDEHADHDDHDHDKHEDEHADHDDHDHDKYEDEHADHGDHDHDKHEDKHADHDDHDHDKHEDEHADHDDHDHDKHDEEHADHDDHSDHDDHDHGAFDPHAWQTIENAVIYVDNIAAALAKIDPENAAIYYANRAQYVAELEALDAEITRLFETVPDDKRTVVTSHDAFGYLAAHYGMTFEAPQGMSTESEASAADVAAIITQIKEEGISAVFVESITDNRLIEQIANETGAVVGGTLYSGSLSDSEGPASTYIDMMRHNAKTLTDALGS